MKLFFAFFSLLVCALPARQQTVRIGEINWYGNRSIPDDTISKYAGIHEGDTISYQSLAARKIEKSLEQLPNVMLAKTAVVCCDGNNNYILFAGVAENESQIVTYRRPPTLKIKLPEAYTNAYSHFARRFNDAILANQADDDWSQGHSMIRYAPARKVQEKYLRWANSDFDALKKIVRSSAYEGQRATAVQIIAYNDDKKRLIPELLYAMGDNDNEVRNNAVKALSALSYYMALHPGKFKIPFQPFVRLINSVTWADRTKGLSVIMQLSETRDKELFELLRASSMRSLKEMALWKSKTHAMPAFIILSRMAGYNDEKIFKMTSGDRFAEEARKLVYATE